MTTPTSLTAGFSLGVQKVQGTAASTGYITGSMQTSGINSKYVESDPQDEHRGTSGRPTKRQSSPINTGVTQTVKGTWRLYPSLIGAALIGAGFKVRSVAQPTVTTAAMVQTITMTNATGGTWRVAIDGASTAALAYNVANADLQTALVGLSTVGAGNVTVSGTPGASYVLTFGSGLANTNVSLAVGDATNLTGASTPTLSTALTTPCAGDAYIHTFTLNSRNYIQYLSALHAIDEGAALFTRRAVDCRVSKLSIAASPTGIIADMDALGISIGAAAGTESKTAEALKQLSQSLGAFSILESATQITSYPRSHTLTITQALADDDHKLHSLVNASIPVIDNDITGELADLDLSYNFLKRLQWGGTSGTTNVATIPEVALDYNYITSAYVTGTTPYKLQVVIPTAALRISTDWQASGNNLIRCACSYAMKDLSAAEPITITLTNGIPHYCGS